MVFGRAILGVSALVFIAYGLVSIVSPAIPAGFAGLEMTSGDAFAEIGAMYGGLQTGLGAFCLLALFKSDYYRAGLALLTIAIGALVFARFISFLLASDAVTAYTYGALIFEFSIAALAATAFFKK